MEEGEGDEGRQGVYAFRMERGNGEWNGILEAEGSYKEDEDGDVETLTLKPPLQQRQEAGCHNSFIVTCAR